MSSTLQSHVDNMIQHIETGKILEAMETFYASDVTMTEPAYGATTGLAENIEREKHFLAQVKTWGSFKATAVGVNETAPGTGVALIENTLDFTNQQDEAVHMEQVTVQQWKDGKIFHERFYYDTGK